MAKGWIPAFAGMGMVGAAQSTVIHYKIPSSKIQIPNKRRIMNIVDKRIDSSLLGE